MIVADTAMWLHHVAAHHQGLFFTMALPQGVRKWGKRFGTQVFHKGVVLPASVWNKLNSEQVALVELLILVRCCGSSCVRDQVCEDGIHTDRL